MFKLSVLGLNVVEISDIFCDCLSSFLWENVDLSSYTINRSIHSFYGILIIFITILNKIVNAKVMKFDKLSGHYCFF